MSGARPRGCQGRVSSALSISSRGLSFFSDTTGTGWFIGFSSFRKTGVLGLDVPRLQGKGSERNGYRMAILFSQTSLTTHTHRSGTPSQRHSRAILFLASASLVVRGCGVKLEFFLLLACFHGGRCKEPRLAFCSSCLLGSAVAEGMRRNRSERVRITFTAGWRDLFRQTDFAAVHRISAHRNLSFVKYWLRHVLGEKEGGRADERACMVSASAESLRSFI